MCSSRNVLHFHPSSTSPYRIIQPTFSNTIQHQFPTKSHTPSPISSHPHSPTSSIDFSIQISPFKLKRHFFVQHAQISFKKIYKNYLILSLKTRKKREFFYPKNITYFPILTHFYNKIP